MEQGRFQEAFRILIAFCCLLIIGRMTLGNATVFVKPIRKHLQGEMSFSDMTAEIAAGYYTDSLTNKYDFVNMNGLFARMTGKRQLNQTLLMKNGMLTNDRAYAPRSMKSYANGMVMFSDYLKEFGSCFIYSAIPYKSDMLTELVPAGINLGYHKVWGDDFVSYLAKNGVAYVDLRQDLIGTVEQLNQYYYRTDHHWTPDGAFVGFRSIMNKMKEIDPELDLSYTDRDMWELHIKQDWFLGSHGKRVGTLFTGVDDLMWLTPRFETEMSCANLKHHSFYKGDYEAAIIRQEFIDEADYFQKNAYYVYIGGGYPLVLHRNTKAPNRGRILMIKDSFTPPLQALFAAAFTEVDVIDPRYYTDSTIAEYCAWTQPDFVLMNTLVEMVIDKAYTSYGASDAMKTQIDAQWTPVREIPIINIEANDKAYHFHEVSVPFERGRTYRVSFDDLELTEGTAAGASVLLYDWTMKKIVSETIYGIGYCHQNGGRTWTFRVPDDDHRYGLLLYAGLYSNAANNGIKYTGFSVEKME